MDLLALALAVMLGFVLGLAAGAARAFRLTARRRAAAGAAAGLARFGLGSLPTRTAEDILAGRVRVVLGGVQYALPVLPRRRSREWLEALDARFAEIASALDEAADDKPRILALLTTQTTGLLEMLRAYDVTDVLPAPEYLDEFATDSEVLVAMVEVWRAANPLADSLAATADEGTDGTSSALSSSSPPPTGGTRLPSRTASPTSS